MKICCTCRRELPDERFGKNQNCSGGLNTKCKDCVRDYQREHRQRNRERIREVQRSWNTAHIEERRAAARKAQKKRREADPEGHKARLEAWLKSHPGYRSIAKARHRAKARGLSGDFTLEEWNQLKARHDHRCVSCGRQEPQVRLEPDHVVSVHAGGVNSIENIQPLCRNCNARKERGCTDYRRSSCA